MKKRIFGIAVCALALAGCGHDTVFDDLGPQGDTAENYPALEEL